MSGTNYIASNWRVPENSNSSKNDNYSLSFNGSSSTINCGNITALNGKTNASWSFWLNCGTTGINGIMNQWGSGSDRLIYGFIWLGGGRIDIYMSGNLAFRVSSNAVINALSTGQWFNLIITYDGTQATSTDRVKAYIDNQELTGNIGGGPTSLFSSTTDFVIGTYPSGTYWNGQMSDVALFDYTLDSLQVSTLYGNATLGAGNPMALKPTPVAYYPLGDNSSGGIDVGPTSILTQPNVSVDDASVFTFDGTNYIESSNISELNGSAVATWSGWIKRSSATGGFYTMGTWGSAGTDRQMVLFQSSNLIRVLIGDGTIFDTAFENTMLTADTEWHNIIIVYDGSLGNTSKVKLYYDTTPLTNTATGTNVTTLNTSSNGFTIGALGTGTPGVNWFIGEISNVAIWNTDETSEIANIYNNGIPATSYTNTPIAWWKLDQSANWEADTSGNWQIPDAVSAYPQSFDFSSSNIESNKLNISTAITISAWVKTTTTSNTRIIVNEDNWGSNRNWHLYIAGSNKVLFRAYDAGGNVVAYIIRIAAGEVTDGKWHNIVVTWDGTTSANAIKLAIDNDIETATATGTGIKTSNAPLSIGSASNSASTNSFTGVISNVQVWDNAVSNSQIAELYNNGTPLTTAIQSANLKGWWKLDDTATFSTNWTIPDASGNGNTGISSGMTEQSLVNNNVSTLNGESSGMTSGNLVLSDLTRNLPYENYSMAFDGTEYIETASTFSLLDGQTSATFSIWIKPNAVNIFQYLFSIVRSAISTQFQVACHLDTLARIRVYGDTTSLYTYSNTGVVSAGVWTHLCITFDLSQPLVADRVVIYVNGVDETDPSFRNMAITQFQTSTSGMSIAKNQNNHLPEFEGLLSQFSVFNSTLTSTEVLKLYANGLPQDLTNFTPQPDSWWTLGKESFWNGSDWIVRDMIGSNDGTSANMAVSDLVGDASRSEANGTGTNMDIPTNLVGNAGFSDKNAYSINMGPSARVTDTP